MISLRKATARSHAHHGWMESWHSFSFADYHGPCMLSLSPRRVVGAVPVRIPQHSKNAVFATVYSTTRTDRTGLETRPTNRHPQLVLYYPHRSARCRRNLFRSLTKGQSGTAQIMSFLLTQ